MFGLFKKKLDVDDFIAGSVEGLALTTDIHRQSWRFGEEASWNIDQDAGLIVFTFADGVVASSPVQIVGTFNGNDGTFLWGWDHPSILPPLREDALRVKAFANEHGLAELASRKVSCTAERAW